MIRGSLGSLVVVLTLAMVGGCGENPHIAQGRTPYSMLALFHRSAKQTKTLTTLTSAGVWAGKCSSRNQPRELWGAAVVLENQRDITHLKFLGGPRIPAKAFYGSKKEDILSASNALLQASLKYQGQNNALIGPSDDQHYLVYARLGMTPENLSILYLGAISTPQSDTSFRCYFSHDKTSRTHEQNERADRAMPAILK